MNCEIEFLPVGEGSKPGDAIVIRYGTLESYELMLVDGGFDKTGEQIVAHLKKYFGDAAALTHIVLTHADGDHASGIREVLRGIPVKNIWMHIPWLLCEDVRNLFKDKTLTKDGLSNTIKKEYDILSEIVDLGIKQKCQFYYPFEGSIIGPFTVLSPDRYAYTHLLPQFDKTPDPDQPLIESLSMWIGKQPSALQRLFEKAIAKAQTWVTETWDRERLKDGGVTAASNESSVVMYADLGDQGRVLLTGDAGVNALKWAADFADARQLLLQNFSLVQIPHHGSRRNVGPSILNRLLGAIQAESAAIRFSAYVSAPPDDDTHPRKMVLNAFRRRGGRIGATQGKKIIWYGGFPNRADYQGLVEIPFSSQVEDYD